ncbi:zinc finger CCCH domain-containing protein 39-like [Actinidia eriantha]|uniref:zinc finger CCCH domain-containing protein 39-like n=1 Tax=Actinidia eriantha TaxID=165200 RepID=UPI0025851709|nr:zinc finger CCCH domain-containing protein 39-like [Actinidia eriantha]
MDQKLTTLSPVNMCLMAHTHQNFNPSFESGGGAVNLWPQYAQQSMNVSHIEYPSFKKPRPSQTTMDSTPQLCLQFQRGHCSYGHNCQFAHGIGGTQNLLPHKLVKNESNVDRYWNGDGRIISEMKLCRRFCNGEVCPYGQRCHFLHEGPARFRESCAISIGTTGSGIESKPLVHSSLNAKQNSQKPVFPKTRLCYKWEATGNCPFGTNCYFAHGHAELQKFRSQTTEYGNVSTSKMIPTAATHASPSRTGNGTACEKQIQGKKCLFKWKGFEKISRIYADWIDDVPLVHS